MSSILSDIKKISLLSHGHKHLPTLEKISINENGKICFSNEEIKGSEINAETINKLFENVEISNIKFNDYIIVFDNNDNLLKKIKKEKFNNMFITKVNGKGVIFGGKTSSSVFSNIIDTFFFDIKSNAHMFGNLSYGIAKSYCYGTALKGFLVFGTNGITNKQTREKIFFASETDSVQTPNDFFNGVNIVAFSNETIGISTGGDSNSTSAKFCFATESNSTTHFDYAAFKSSCAFSTPTYGVCAGGFINGALTAYGNTISLFNETQANTLQVLPSANKFLSCTANKIKAAFFGGESIKTISWFYHSTRSYSTLNGINLSSVRKSSTALSDGKTAVVCGGDDGTTYTNTIECLNLITLASIEDFGDLTVARTNPASISSSHNGINSNLY